MTSNKKKSEKNNLYSILNEIDYKLVREGLNYSFIERIIEYGVNLEEISIALDVSVPVLKKRKKQYKLNMYESDKIYRLLTILTSAESLFEGNKIKALKWCKSPAIGLGNERPIDFSDTSLGQRIVINYIHRIEHGVIN